MNCPWYVRNADLQRDIDIETVTNVINLYAIAHNLRLSRHINEEASKLVSTVTTQRKLKSTRTQDLV